MGNSGSYAFIPDGSFVGTIFVNAISNLLTTAATNLQLTVGGIQPSVDTSSNYIRHYSTETSNEKVKLLFIYIIRSKKVSSKQRKLQIWSSPTHQYFIK
jgi:hypothetical protein